MENQENVLQWAADNLNRRSQMAKFKEMLLIEYQGIIMQTKELIIDLEKLIFTMKSGQ